MSAGLLIVSPLDFVGFRVAVSLENDNLNLEKRGRVMFWVFFNENILIPNLKKKNILVKQMIK